LLPVDAVYLEVRESNKGAVNFYEQFNFKKDRVVPGYYETGEGAIIMYLPLNTGKVSGQ
jgi:ribosomal-protein-alanine N-acetyltransferase